VDPHLNRWPKSAYVAGLSPFAPQKWCSYLRAVRSAWQTHGWLSSYAYLWGMDEPGAARFRILERQAKVGHACFRGSHVIVTANPTPDNRFLWNGGRDDVDSWVVLASRYYGKYTNPSLTRRHISHANLNLRYIDAVRHRHKQIWTYTYDAGSHTTPGFTATEPLSDPRVFVDWAALEGITGLLYGQGTTTYAKGNPLVSNDRHSGAYVLIYPGRDGPIPSARLEVLREGIEDWEILNVVRHKHGAGAVRRILSGLFSTTAKGVELGCVIGCQIKTSTKYSWPVWSHDASTPAKVASMRVAALQAAS
jgi:Glycoside hydrolase 123, catalytic domain